MKRVAGLLACVVVATSLTGCGQDGDYHAGGVDARFKGYCAVVSAQQTPITDAIAKGDAVGLLYALPSFQKLRAQAPDDISNDWDLIVSRVGALQQALDDAGVTPEDYDPDKTPATLDATHRRAIEQAAADLLSTDLATSFTSVEQEARDVCKTSLGFG